MIDLILGEIATFFIEDKFILKLFGVPGDMFGIRHHFYLFRILSSSAVLSYQAVYYFNHERSVYLISIKEVQMLSGSIIPSSMGVPDSNDLARLVRVCGSIFRFMKFISTSS